MQPPPQHFATPLGHAPAVSAERLAYFVQNSFDNFPAPQTFNATVLPVELYSAVPQSGYQNIFPGSSLNVNGGTLDSLPTFHFCHPPDEPLPASIRQLYLSKDALGNTKLTEAPFKMDATMVSEEVSFVKSASTVDSANRAQQIGSLSHSIAALSSVNRENMDRPHFRRTARGMSSLPNIPTVIGSSTSLYTGRAQHSGAINSKSVATPATIDYAKARVQGVLHSNQSTISDEC